MATVELSYRDTTVMSGKHNSLCVGQAEIQAMLHIPVTLFIDIWRLFQENGQIIPGDTHVKLFSEG